jgi:transcriptional regulator with XRE-family HTH domain
MENRFMHEGAVLIRTASARLGFSQREIAQSIGVSAQAVNKWWHGESEPSREHFAPLERLLELQRGDLSLLYGLVPAGRIEVERDGNGDLLVRVSGSSDPGWLKGMEPLFDNLVAA